MGPRAGAVCGFDSLGRRGCLWGIAALSALTIAPRLAAQDGQPAPAALAQPSPFGDQSAGEQTQASRELPDASAPDEPNRKDSASATVGDSTAPSAGSNLAIVTNPASERVALADCPYDETRAPECRVHRYQLATSLAFLLAFQNAGNLYDGYWFRWETTHGQWWNEYVGAVEGWRWNRWKDDNPFLDDYVGHPMLGAMYNYLWIQNDPKGMTLEQANTWAYWRSRLRALSFSTFMSFEWKMGPVGEASIGHTGSHYFTFTDQGAITNETGWVELVTTPVGGFLWTLAEDGLDRVVIRRLEAKSRNPLLLTGYQFLSPARAIGNIFRFRPPWYRDSRTVKASSFWSDPDDNLPEWPRPGGVHEFGALWGLSLVSGSLWGEERHIYYMPVMLHYSYLLSPHKHWTLRYSPEVTALAMLDERVPGATDPLNMRKRTYGSGVSPEGFQLGFLPSHQWQPFLSHNDGLLCFTGKVLSPQASRWLYTVDFGAGVNIFRKQRQAVTIGYRYQYFSNFLTGVQSRSTDANTLYIAVSRFRTKGYR